MKIFSKIGVLLMALTLVVGGIMYYAKTKVETPELPTDSDVYGIDMVLGQRDLNTTKNENELDYVFNLQLDRIFIYNNEKKITPSIFDAGLKKLTGIYTPKFVKESYSKFNSPVWYEGDHNNILTNITRLKSLRNSKGEMALSSSALDSLSRVSDIIYNYRDARSISRYRSFTDITTAHTLTAKAKKYTSDKYLSKCTDLNTDLKNVVTSIESSHYSFVSNEVDRLSQFRFLGNAFYYGTLVPYVEKNITDYDKNATELYGNNRKSVESLKKRVQDYKNQAMRYYNQVGFH